MYSQQAANRLKMLETLGRHLPGTSFYQLVRYPDGKKEFTYLSENIVELTGKTAEEICRDPELLFGTTLPEYLPVMKAAEERSYRDMTVFDVEIECISARGERVCLHITSTPERLSDGLVCWHGIQTDITKIRQTQNKLSKYNHELTLLNSINDIILEAKDESSLLDNVCTCLVKQGAYKLAWIGYAPHDDSASQKVYPAAAFGETGYLSGLNIDLGITEMREGPTAGALLHGRTMITNNFETSPNFRPWLKNARKYGISASLVLPLEFGNNKRAALNIYSPSINAFDKHEVTVLERLSRNLSLSIRNLRLAAEKDHTRFLLNERVKELSCIYLINKSLQSTIHSQHEIMQQVVELLPRAWQHNTICEARIVLGEKIYTTTNFRNTPFVQTCHIRTAEGISGLIEVVYLEERPPADEGPFQKEERELLNTIGEIITLHLNKEAAYLALQKSEANLKTVFDNTSVGYMLMDRDMRIISYNHSLGVFAERHHISLNAGTILHEAMPEDRKQKVFNILNAITASGRTRDYETFFEENGHKTYYTVSAVPISSGPATIGICLSVHDVSRNKFMEAERQSIMQDLLQRNRDLEQFAYIVSHNLRAPLASILGLTSLLEDERNRETIKTALAGIRSSTARLDMVIRDLHTILQVRREVSEFKVNVDFAELVKHIMESISQTVSESRAKIITDFSEAPSMPAIRTYLESIFFNLITNSIKYTKPGTDPVISIRTHRASGRIHIEFSDNGLGIDLNQYGLQLFGLYKRFHPHVEGKGLGLFMVKTQVEVMGGSISASSTPGKGVQFNISFPDTVN